MTIRVSCAQIYPKLGDKEYNLQKMEHYIAQTMTEYPDTKLIVFPELATSGYEGTVDQFQALAETVEDGESIRRIGALAARYGIYIVYGFPERDPELTDVLYTARSIHLPASVSGVAPVANFRSLIQRSDVLES